MGGLRAKIAHFWIIFARKQAIDFLYIRGSANGVSLSARKSEAAVSPHSRIGRDTFT